MPKNNHLSLEQLEKDIWPAPDFPSHLVTRCHALQKKPLCDLEVEDLRMLIGQAIGLDFLLPAALAILEKDPLAEGDFFAGDLLIALVRNPAQGLPMGKGERRALIGICQAALASEAPGLAGKHRQDVEIFLSDLTAIKAN